MLCLMDNADARWVSPIRPIYSTWVLFLIPVMCGSRSGDGGVCSKMAWVLFLIPVMWGSRSGEGGACPKVAWVLILIPVM